MPDESFKLEKSIQVKTLQNVYITIKETWHFFFFLILEMNENAYLTCSISKNVFKEKIFISNEIWR